MSDRASPGRPDPATGITLRSEHRPAPAGSARLCGPPRADDTGQRGRFIDAFAAVVAENGYPRTTIEHVATAAGLPEKAFYSYFTDLDDCFLAAYRHGTGTLLRHVEAACRAESSWRGAVRSGLRVVLESAAAEPAFARMSLIDASDAGARVHRARLAFLARMRSLLTRPDLPEVTDVVRDAVVGGVYTAVYNTVESDRIAELPELLPPMSDFVLRILGGGSARDT